MLLGNLTLVELIANLLALGVGMTVHEFAHNYVGYRMGDPTPKQLGRLTLNPLVHINWIGWLMFAILGFGILGSAPINPYNMPRENRRWRWLAAVAAGPLSNLVIAIVTAILFRLLFALDILLDNQVIFTIIIQMVFFNLILFLFNIIPLSPLDGWQIVYCLLPYELASQWERYKQTTMYIFFGLLLLSFVPLPGIPNIFGLLIGEPARQLFRLLLGF